jgi:methyl-accepting chemotaxis protein
MTVGRKLLLAFLINLVAVIAVGVTGLVTLRQVQNEAFLLYTKNTASLEALLSITQDYQRLESLVRDLVLARDPVHFGEFQSKRADLETAFRNDWGAYQAASNKDEDVSRILAGFNQTYSDYRLILDRIFDLVQAQDYAAATDLLQDDGAMRARDMNYQVDGLVASNRQSASARYLQTEHLTAEVWTLTLVMLAFAAILSLLSSFWLSRNLVGPLVRTASLAQRLSEGDLTLGKLGSFGARKDEVGVLARSVETLTSSLSNFVTTLKASEGDLGQSAGKLEERASTTAAAAARIAGAAREGNDLAQAQTARIGDTSSTVDRIVEEVENFDRLIEDQTSSVAQTTSSIEEMASSIRSLTARATSLGRAFSELRTASDEGQEKLFSILEKVGTIEAQSDRLAEANDTVKEIAGQTNLLSMNAAIEAAHAGDAGAGFAVVADEIRKLADQTGVHSRAITQEVTAIRNLIAGAASESEAARLTFEAIVLRIGELGRFEAELTAALNEQGIGAQQILKATTQMSQVSTEVRRGSTQILDGTRVINQEINDVEELGAKIQANLQGILGDGIGIAEASAEVQAQSAQNRELSTTLAKTVSHFHV